MSSAPIMLTLLAAVGMTACTPSDPATQTSAQPADADVATQIERAQIERTHLDQTRLEQTNALPADTVGLVDGIPIRTHELDRYLGLVQMRTDAANDVLNQIVTEALVEQAAGKLGLIVDEQTISERLEQLDQMTREAADGQGLRDQLVADVPEEDLRAGVRVMVQLEQIVRVEQGLAADAPVPASLVGNWLGSRLSEARLESRPLDDPVAATWTGGEIPRTELGRRLRVVLPPTVVRGVLHEMMGIRIVNREARQRGITLSVAAATAEILERETFLRSRPGMAETSYEEFVRATQDRSLEELLGSEAFGTEVLLDLIVLRDWDEARQRALFEEQRERFTEQYGPLGFEDLRYEILDEIRDRTYRDMMAAATIVMAL